MTPDAQMYERIKALMDGASEPCTCKRDPDSPYGPADQDECEACSAQRYLYESAEEISAFAIEQYEAREKLETALREIVAIESGRMYGACPDCDTPDACRENGCVVKSLAQMRAEGALPPAQTAATPDMGQEG